jgi:peroxiredoxin
MKTTPRLLAALALLLSVLLAPARAETPGEELLGRPAPGWDGLRWLGTPLGSEALRGKVVLLRWWSDECPMCRGTLPGLQRLYDEHQQEGLVLVGVYHPKPARPVTDAEVTRYRDGLGVRFPVAIDADWTVLKRWWLTGRPRAFTSVSFLVDRKGTIRWLHRGGEFHPSRDPEHKDCDAAFSELQRTLAQALKEPAP